MGRKKKNKKVAPHAAPVNMDNVLKLQTTICSNNRFGPSSTKTVKSNGGIGRLATHISGVAQRLVPLKQNRGMGPTKRAVGYGNSRKLNKKLKKLAHKATREHRPRSGSKLALVFFLLLGVLGTAGGYYGYNNPSVFSNLDVAETIGVNALIAKVKSFTDGDNAEPAVVKSKRVPIKSIAAHKKASKKKVYRAKKKSSKKRSYAKSKKYKKRAYAAKKKYKKRTYKKKTSKSQQRKAWQRKLAKLKKKSRR